MRTDLLLALCVAFTLPGCATTGILSKFSNRESVQRATAADPAVRCLCVWQTAEGSDPDGRPCRGVAGQVFFFSRSSAVPVAVDGDVKVYVFDDQGTEEEQSQPIAKYDVDNATWNTQLTKTQFGPAYQIFVPHTRAGRQETRMAVRMKMTPLNGPPVFSDLATIELAGPKASVSKLAPQSETAVKVDQALRSQFANREQPDLRTSSSLADARCVAAEVFAANRHNADTIAMIRPANDNYESAGAQFQVADQWAELDDQLPTTPMRVKLRSRTE